MYNLQTISILITICVFLGNIIFGKKYKATAPKWLKTAINMLVLTTYISFFVVLIRADLIARERLKELEALNKSQGQTKQR
jgi:hypothetical protein